MKNHGETVWVTQAMMAELFGTTQQNISTHLVNIYEEKELLPEATNKKLLSVCQEDTRTVQRERTTDVSSGARDLRHGRRRTDSIPRLDYAGSVGKQTADEHAAAQYDEFSAPRRGYKETQDEKDYLAHLEEIARNGGNDLG